MKLLAQTDKLEMPKDDSLCTRWRLLEGYM